MQDTEENNIMLLPVLLPYFLLVILSPIINLIIKFSSVILCSVLHS